MPLGHRVELRRDRATATDTPLRGLLVEGPRAPPPGHWRRASRTLRRGRAARRHVGLLLAPASSTSPSASARLARKVSPPERAYHAPRLAGLGDRPVSNFLGEETVAVLWSCRRGSLRRHHQEALLLAIDDVADELAVVGRRRASSRTTSTSGALPAMRRSMFSAARAIWPRPRSRSSARRCSVTATSVDRASSTASLLSTPAASTALRPPSSARRRARSRSAFARASTPRSNFSREAPSSRAEAATSSSSHRRRSSGGASPSSSRTRTVFERTAQVVELARDALEAFVTSPLRRSRRGRSGAMRTSRSAVPQLLLALSARLPAAPSSNACALARAACERALGVEARGAQSARRGEKFLVG